MCCYSDRRVDSCGGPDVKFGKGGPVGSELCLTGGLCSAVFLTSGLCVAVGGELGAGGGGAGAQVGVRVGKSAETTRLASVSDP